MMNAINAGGNEMTGN
jgi:hypothetical protein